MNTIDITKSKKDVFDLVRDTDLDYPIAITLAEKIAESCRDHEDLSNINFDIDVLRSHIYDMKKNEKIEVDNNTNS